MKKLKLVSFTELATLNIDSIDHPFVLKAWAELYDALHKTNKGLGYGQNKIIMEQRMDSITEQMSQAIVFQVWEEMTEDEQPI